MQLNNDEFDDFLPTGNNQSLEINGLDRFIKNLEKHFFSQVTVRNCSKSNISIDLVVELDCNFELSETLHHFEKETWGNFKSTENSFDGAMNQLRACNNRPIKIEEFSLFLKDTSIIVNRINEQNISAQLENIFIKLNEHAIIFTRGLSETPFEIYVPVFEDDVIENEHRFMDNENTLANNEKDYFSFWGLYYYSEEDALVYDLKSQLIIKGNLHMLNR